jgi:hypothetical protein
MELRKQYYFQQSKQGLLAWDFHKLIAKASELEVKAVALNEISEIDECYWYDLGGAVPTCRNIIEHMELILQADLRYPIILSSNGRVMDGMHRVCKAMLENKEHIRAVQFEEIVQPDFIGIAAEDLPYD